MQKDKENIWNIPNALTIFRILLIPLYFYLILAVNHYTGALLVFIAASGTDLLDGFIARKFHLITNFGKLIDPLADKLLVTCVILSLIVKGIIPLYVLVVIIIKELIMVLGGIYMYKKGIVVYSKTIGKIAQTILISSLLLFLLSLVEKWFVLPANIMLYGGVFLTLAALVFYTVSASKQLKASRQVPSPVQSEKKNQ